MHWKEQAFPLEDWTILKCSNIAQGCDCEEIMTIRIEMTFESGNVQEITIYVINAP